MPKTELGIEYSCCHKHFREEFKHHNIQYMLLCPTCGNKRCPKASDCSLACTNSNNSGQKGSIYDIHK